MYRLLDLSKGLENLDMGKIANTQFIKGLDFLRSVFGSVIGEASMDRTASIVLETSSKYLLPKDLTPEMSNYFSRIALRTLVGLPIIDINDRDKDAVHKLKGSISWISKKEIDVTEIIRDIRDG